MRILCKQAAKYLFITDFEGIHFCRGGQYKLVIMAAEVFHFRRIIGEEEAKN